MTVDLNAYAGLTALRDIATDTFLCDWVAGDHIGGHDWCPTVLEPGDTYALVVMGETIVGRYCTGCGYHLFGTPELEPAPLPVA
ncbi:hypothetical protein [Kribbella sp. NPDC051770]|uniref:hypothetical protein n=1 Tax=Kribbella sp. NPDC051770 TaxID=3155413 RepID=UPI0034435435